MRVLDDAEKVKNLQPSAGVEWTEEMCDVGILFSSDRVTTAIHYCLTYVSV